MPKSSFYFSLGCKPVGLALSPFCICITRYKSWGPLSPLIPVGALGQYLNKKLSHIRTNYIASQPLFKLGHNIVQVATVVLQCPWEYSSGYQLLNHIMVFNLRIPVWIEWTVLTYQAALQIFHFFLNSSVSGPRPFLLYIIETNSEDRIMNCLMGI